MQQKKCGKQPKIEKRETGGYEDRLGGSRAAEQNKAVVGGRTVAHMPRAQLAQLAQLERARAAQRCPERQAPEGGGGGGLASGPRDSPRADSAPAAKLRRM
ncbi:hypothetical protein AXG93_1504s1100 [Marchantia polymorpha subsp. ruderalis]|uniref:Uncharacterized protein n=1 Tax=Marchantia polymorpha subsp. ruderalis TaxID=1480154 RepID=A0A176VN39_MARPO|nr:hypothetical protein AXG93_1504s1100 [Marchantia polymorpha subsp. ruderalis]